MGHGTSVIPWPIKIAIIGVLAWIAWRLSRPATYGLGMVGHAAGFAWSFAAGRARHTWHQPAQHAEREPVAATTTPTRTPSQHVVFMPGITDRPIATPVLGPALQKHQASSRPAAQIAETIGPRPRRSANEEFPPPTVLRRVKEARLGPRTRFRYDYREPNTAYEVEGRGTFYTDDFGRVVHGVTDYGDRQYPNPDLNAPEPGMTYVVGDRHVFITDEQGRTITATDPQPSPAPAHRSQTIQQSVGSEAGEGYDGGHLIMHAHGGGRERINIVAQLAEMNRSGTLKYGSLPNSFYKFERFLNEEVNRGKDVYLTLYVDYEDDETKTPDLITAEYKVDGQVRRRRFPNVR